MIKTTIEKSNANQKFKHALEKNYKIITIYKQ